MPARKHKVDHRRGGGDHGKHISSFEEVKARNAGEETAYDKMIAERAAKKKGATEDDEGEAAPEPQETRPRTGVGGIAVENPNAQSRNIDKEGVELTRKQREEIEKQQAKARYEKLHKEGKTDEAKADLARLEKVKQQREEAAKKRAEEEAAAKEKEEHVDAKTLGRQAMTAVLKEQGAEAAKIRGSKSTKKEEKDDAEKEEDKKKKDEKKDDYAYVSTDKKDNVPAKKVTDGTIEQCREAEEDFM